MELEALTRSKAAAVPAEPPQGKENVCPTGEKGLIGSPLPEGYPRRPLQDITGVLESVGQDDENLRQSSNGKSTLTLKQRKGSKSTIRPKSKKTNRVKIVVVEEMKTITAAEQVVLVTKANSRPSENGSEKPAAITQPNSLPVASFTEEAKHVEEAQTKCEDSPRLESLAKIRREEKPVATSEDSQVTKPSSRSKEAVATENDQSDGNQSPLRKKRKSQQPHAKPPPKPSSNSGSCNKTSILKFR